jgi:predicted nucleic acid-binding Zn ribbon protein
MKHQNESTLKEVMQDFFRRNGLEDQYFQAKLQSQWEEIIGKAIANHTTDLYIHHDKLFLYIDSAPLKHELSILKPRIINLVNQKVGKSIIKDVIIK